MWAGTGEAWAIRDSDVMGNGIYKSIDAGRTWTHMGLDETGRIGRLIVHPTNPNIVFACALGRMTGPQQERGVYRTTDGGAHWERVLFVNENTGCSGISMDAKNPQAFYSRGRGRWRCTPMANSAAGRAAAYTSRVDGGSTWSRMTRARTAEIAGRQDRCRGRADQFRSRVRADSDGGPRLDVAIG